MWYVWLVFCKEKSSNFILKISEYPFVMKYGLFPMGTPRSIIVKKDENVPPFPWKVAAENPYKGLLLCRVLPPYKMNPAELPPLLPYFCLQSNKLYFPLCAKCADIQQIESCSHSMLERSWVGGFTHLELNKVKKWRKN